MSKKENYILDTFLRLTSRTCPYGFEDSLVKELKEEGIFPADLQIDEHGNYYYKIGESRTIFAAHLDTVGKETVNVVHVIKDNEVHTDGKTILGADDKAGVTIMLYMIRFKVPGLYYFFLGEECGCVGSSFVARLTDLKGKYDRIVSFDRRGVDSIITYQSYSRCCSDKFADALAKEFKKLGLSYKKDDGGVYTDSAEFTNVIPECTNISVGYYREHTVSESQNIKHLTHLANACLHVNWESLPVERDMSKSEYKSYSTYGSAYSGAYNYKSRNTSYAGGHNTYSSGSRYTRSYDTYDDWHDGDSYSAWYEDDKYVNTVNKDKSVNKSEPTIADLIENDAWEEEYEKYKKTRRSRKKSRTTYVDNGTPESIPISDTDMVVKHDDNYYNSLVDIILSSKLTKSELEILKEQYFDFKNEKDVELYEFLMKNIIV